MTIPRATLDGVSAGKTLWDAVVLGAGPAGAMTARELARRGILTLLVERSSFPRFKVCGACLNQRAISSLNSAGLTDLLPKLGAVPTTHFRVFCRQRSAEIDLPGGMAVSREALDSALVQEAIQAGAQFLPETTATLANHTAGDNFRSVDLSGADRRTATIRSRIVLAADGLGNPALRHCCEFSSRVSPQSKLGVGAQVVASSNAFQPGTIYMAAGRGGYVGLVRVEDGSLNLAAAVAPQTLRHAGSPQAAVSAILSEAGVPKLELPGAAAWRGTLPLTRQTVRCVGHRVFVLGDAAGYVEPFTGEGMAWALGSGMAVAPLVERALHSWTAAVEQDWLKVYGRLVRDRQNLCRGFAWLLRYPRIVELAIHIASVGPGLFRPIVTRLNRPVARQEVCNL